MLCREILVVDPFTGTNWNAPAQDNFSEAKNIGKKDLKVMIRTGKGRKY